MTPEYWKLFHESMRKFWIRRWESRMEEILIETTYRTLPAIRLNEISVKVSGYGS